MARSIYLAGPEVFLQDAIEIGRRKCRICQTHGFIGRFPLDSGPSSLGSRVSGAIFSANMRMLAECDLIIANLTPFRGISADVGTVFELGAAYALGKPVFGYSNLRGTLIERLTALPEFQPFSAGPDGRLYATDGLAVEDFGLTDNLMIAEALLEAGHGIVLPERPVADIDRDLEAFEACVRMAARAKAGGRPG